LAQDDFYLQDLLSTLGILVAKSEKELKRFAIWLLQETLQGEIAMHESIAKDQGGRSFPKGEIATIYGDFLLRTAYEGDVLNILVSVSPCFLSYKEIAEKLVSKIVPAIPPTYRLWIESYVSEGYRKLTDTLLAHLEREAQGISGVKREHCISLFKRATELEYQFWQESYKLP
ncbi:MAG: TenA family protein, partial [Candidatus Caldatribacteriaceae bacterium]